MKIVEPLVKVLRLVDGERLAMDFIYEAMDQAKEQIKAVYTDKVAKYGPICEIIDQDGTINSIAIYMQLDFF